MTFYSPDASSTQPFLVGRAVSVNITQKSVKEHGAALRTPLNPWVYAALQIDSDAPILRWPLCTQPRQSNSPAALCESPRPAVTVAPLKKATSGFRVSHAFEPLLGNDAGGVQLGGSGDTADDRPTARARMGDRGLRERL